MIKFYRKRPVVIQATQMDEDFQIETPEGIMSGKAGDYLVIGVTGEQYPCKRDIFETTYDEVDDPGITLLLNDPFPKR